MFEQKRVDLNEDLRLLQSIKTSHDLQSTLGVDKYLLNKFQIKLSEQAKEILLQFFKFDNLVLLMQIANNNIDFQISSERNIVDFKTALQALGATFPQMNGSILLPFERTESTIEPTDELILGRLPEFCPDAFQ